MSKHKIILDVWLPRKLKEIAQFWTDSGHLSWLSKDWQRPRWKGVFPCTWDKEKGEKINISVIHNPFLHLLPYLLPLAILFAFSFRSDHYNHSRIVQVGNNYGLASSFQNKCGPNIRMMTISWRFLDYFNLSLMFIKLWLKTKKLIKRVNGVVRYSARLILHQIQVDEKELTLAKKWVRHLHAALLPVLG